MAINFPDSPSNGQQVTLAGTTYTYNSAKTKWEIRNPFTSSVFDSAEVVSLIDSSYISARQEAAGVTVYATRSSLPVSGNTAGDQAYVTANNRLYIWNGSGWYSIALLNLAPSIQSVLDSDNGSSPFALATDGTPTTITVTAVDSDGDSLTYGYSADSDFNGLATISQASNVFTITPFSEDSATTSSGTITFTATDDVNTSSSGVQTFTLQFIVQYSFNSTSSTFSNSSLTTVMTSGEVSTVTSDWTSKNTVNSQAVYGTDNEVSFTIPWSVFDTPTTTEFWVYYNHTGVYWQNLLSFETNNDTSAYKHWIWATGNNGAIALGYGPGFNYPTSAPFPWQTWAHVAIVHDISTGTFAQGYGNRIYFGGNLISYGVASAWADYSVSGASNTLIKWWGTATTTSITNLRITQDKLYTSNFTPPAQGSY